VTPTLTAVYDELVRRASSAPHDAAGRSWVRRFVERTGSLSPEHPGSERRLAAAWEDALCRGGLAARLHDELEDPAERDLAALIARAHRGVFAFESAGTRRVVHDLWSGASFVLVARDDVGREVRGDDAGAVCQGRVVGATDGCAMLPGVVFHAPAATPLVETVLAAAAERDLATDEVCDALLRMDFEYRTFTRVRPAFVYRADKLGAG
jgi:hypothetical protein